MTHLYTLPDSPKTLRETLCRVQAESSSAADMALLQRLIDECDRKRPLGDAGTHDDRHTAECGCREPEVEWAVQAHLNGKTLILPCPSGLGTAQRTAKSINSDKTPATAVVVSRPATGWTPWASTGF